VEDTNAATICDPGEYLDGSGVCSDVESRLDALFAELFARLVFVTSTTFTGAEVGGGFGAEGADMHCQRLANAAGHQGRYLAWISDDTSSPRTRFTPSEYPYRRIDGTVIANDFTDLTDGSLLLPSFSTSTVSRRAMLQMAPGRGPRPLAKPAQTTAETGRVRGQDSPDRPP
jgi:hypothetical protein